MLVDARTPLLATELLRPEPHSAVLASSSELFDEVAPCESQEVPAVPEEEPAVQERRGHSPLAKAAAEPAGRPAAEPTRGEDAVQKQQAEPAPPPPPRGPPPAAEDEERAQEAPAEVPAAPVQSSSQEAAAPPEPSARKAGRKRSAAARDDAGRLLYNHQAYATCAARPPAEEAAAAAAAAEAIEVPTWRVNHIASLYSMEGTENLDDEVFRKRHAKLEANEKRRKRLVGGVWLNVDLLMPAVHFVEVVEDLPVLAFGQPIPELQPAEFTLPWVKHPLQSSGERMASKKQRKNMQSKGPWR
ncbi:hypothetical protein HPB52_015774 [Rhipicephalus sanguineus]|uniref:PEHE domain-containing protein n=1 Tax=Rhipicephalus sanguineus TaxID=34632 RepID=A0A9D4Q0R0_RHISA|nr:hypothetical protein HPB52_015774 [Rhipicephalus sanguineus]